ncbi:hypothetical protein MJL79_30830, partial [Salmonella enterica subsp. enterica serovar Montevideo]|nr:hypothetical protein [Salmonella enterica subsp. enterica serovar Montevideo]
MSDVCEAGDRYLDEIFERIQTELNKRGFQIFDLNEGATLAPLYLDKVRGVLERAGVNVDSVILPDGEQYKSLTVLDTVF